MLLKYRMPLYLKHVEYNKYDCYCLSVYLPISLTVSLHSHPVDSHDLFDPFRPLWTPLLLQELTKFHNLSFSLTILYLDLRMAVFHWELPDLSDSEDEWKELVPRIQLERTQLHSIWRYPGLLNHLLELEDWKGENGQKIEKANRFVVNRRVIQNSPWSLPLIKIESRKISINIQMIYSYFK